MGVNRMLAAVLLAAGVPLAAQTVPAGSVAPAPAPSAIFTGTVTVALLTRPTPPGQGGAALVNFAAGARSHWHTHPAGQTLYVTKGCGWTQEEGGPVIRICAGDTVYARPGVKHWHGATATTAMSHLAISETLNGKNVDWLEPVSDSQYRGPAR
jgi:quercetin dioxygenase-like cupin family protein